MIQYKVKHTRLVLDLSKEAFALPWVVLLYDDDAVFTTLGDFVAGTMEIEAKQEYLQGMVYVERISELVFNEGTPIENRRAAINYGNNLSEVLLNTGKYYSEGQYFAAVEQFGTEAVKERVRGAMNGKCHVFSTAIYLLTYDQEMKVAGAVTATPAMLENWTRELSIYEEQGHDLGAPEPFTKYVGALGKVVRVLPDVGPQFY